MPTKGNPGKGNRHGWPPKEKTKRWTMKGKEGLYLIERMKAFNDMDKPKPWNGKTGEVVEYDGNDGDPVDYRCGKQTSPDYIKDVFWVHKKLNDFTSKQFLSGFRTCADYVVEYKNATGGRRKGNIILDLLFFYFKI